MSDTLEVSYTGDILSHLRCPRGWAYHRHVGLHPYEQVQAMEGLLSHHAMEWLTLYYRKHAIHANAEELGDQLLNRYSILRSRGIRSAFAKKVEIVTRVVVTLFPLSNPSGTPVDFDPSAKMDPVIKACVEGALHTEYEIKSVQPLPSGAYPRKARYLLRGVLDLVKQETGTIVYSRVYRITDPTNVSGGVVSEKLATSRNEIEIWDYKASHPGTPYLGDYVRQVLTYAAIYQQHTNVLPARCVLAFLRKPKKGTLLEQVIAIPITDALVRASLNWTSNQIRRIGSTVTTFRSNPLTVAAGDGGCGSISSELREQCTTCGQRFDCTPYKAFAPADCDRSRIDKN